MEKQPERDEFAANLNTDFTVKLVPDGQTSINLVQVTEAEVVGKFENFSLLFRGSPDILLSQMTHRLEHEKLGEFLLFLVPTGQDADGFLYEAVFNRTIE